MKMFTYIVCWDDVHYNVVDNIEKQFVNAGMPHKVINSGNMKRDHWDNVGDIRYYRQFNKALKDFDRSNDYMVFICGDVSHQDWVAVYNRANEVLDKHTNTYAYAPHFTYDPWNEGSTLLKRVPSDKDLLISTNTNGIMYFLHKDVVDFMSEYMDYVDQKHDLKTMISGWGVDLVWSAFAIYNNGLVLRDNKFIVTHPIGSSYDHGQATHETNIIYQSFVEFAKIKGMDEEWAGIIRSRISGRMLRSPDSMSFNSFYNSDPVFAKIKYPINYHVIHINDERLDNRNRVDEVLVGNKLSIKSLNAKDEDLVKEFHDDNPEFKFGWHSFKPGEFGNFGSHYNAWKYLKSSNLDNILVFEDDVLINDSFMEDYQSLMNDLPEDYDVFSIYVDENQFPRYNQKHHVGDRISKGYQDWSTLCYVVSKVGAEKLCRYVEETGMDMPTDWFIFRHGDNGIFNVYTLNPKVKNPVAIDKKYLSQVQ